MRLIGCIPTKVRKRRSTGTGYGLYRKRVEKFDFDISRGKL